MSKSKKEARRKKLLDKIDMYDMIIANLIAGKSIIEPNEHLDNSKIAIGFSNIASESQISKYYLIRKLPDYLRPRIIDEIRNRCILPGLKINFHIYSNPYKIDWSSAEMRNKMSIWRDYARETSGSVDVFDYRNKRGNSIARERIITSTKYLNEAELDHKRSLMRVAIVIEIASNRDEDSILNMGDSISTLKSLCSQYDIKISELRVNLLDWLKVLSPLSLKSIRGVDNKISKKILTDDILANFNSYKQGMIGKDGIPIGMDVLSRSQVLRKFKADPDAAENWLICAETGGGKSYFVKSLIMFLLADNFVVTIMDYEGDEYSNIASYIKSANTEDAKIISMGKGNAQYFDPIIIPELTGDREIDDELKEVATNYVMAIFRIIVGGLNGRLSQWEEKVISTCIQRTYDSCGVTDDKSTWYRSKNLRLSMVYDEIKLMVERKELVDFDTDNVKHKAALKVQESASIYFEEGEAKYGTFSNPISADELYKAKFIVFSFGMKGATNSIADQTMLALRQLSVACVSSQISNHCKYVKHCFNVKVWEEFQRWGEAEGSSEIIINAMTGGRKRGDVNFVITNDLAALLNENNKVAFGIRQNIQNMAIGKIRDKKTREDFCKAFDLNNLIPALDIIAKASTIDEREETIKRRGRGNKYKNSFCLALDNGKRSIVKVMPHPSIMKSNLFRTGVDISKNKE